MAISLPAAGSSAQVSLDNIINLGSTGSISMWFWPTWAQTDGVEHSLFDVRNSGANNYFTINKFSDNSFQVGWYASGLDYRLKPASGSYTLNQNAWNHVLVTWNSGASNRNFFINGTQVSSAGTTFSTWATNGRPMVLGAHDGGDHPANGRIAEFALYNVELTLASGETDALARRFAPPLIKRGLQLYIPFIRDVKKLVDAYGITLATSGTSVADHCPMHYRRAPQFSRTGSAPPPVNRLCIGPRVLLRPQPTPLF